MTDRRIEDLNIASQQVLTSPEDLKTQLPTTSMIADGVMQARQIIKNILDGKDHRLFVVIGPCSIHDPEAALDYGRRLAVLADELKDTLYIVMRVYFEKPRTTVGWKGLINDPDLDNSFDINKGIKIARKLLIDLAESGIPAGHEYLDLISPQYISDVIVPVPAGTGPPGYDVGRRFQGAHVSKEPRHGKDGPQCRRYGFSCVEWLCAGR